MKRGDVYWVRFLQMQSASGSEIRKPRPAVIVTSDASIPHLNRVQVIPLTSNITRRYPGEAVVALGPRPSKALANQIVTVDKSRVLEYEATLSAADLVAVESAMRVQLGL